MKPITLITLFLLNLRLSGGAENPNAINRSQAAPATEVRVSRAAHHAIDFEPAMDERVRKTPSDLRQYGSLVGALALALAGMMITLNALIRRAPRGFESENGFVVEPARARAGFAFAPAGRSLRVLALGRKGALGSAV